MPRATLLPYATTKGAIQNFTGGRSQLLGEKRVRVNCVAPGPVWTPHPFDHAARPSRELRQEHTAGAACSTGELAAAFVMLASDEASYTSGATIAVTGESRSCNRR
ncbi:SDR family oxidoreductase [Novosphingobium sp. BL-52-GroH]|uniref:SDR family oxidoreductase n=1 Tax=Novosphingobium sp. BL-52-GroH TaxID=3349877 RepID=UPI00384BDB4A